MNPHKMPPLVQVPLIGGSVWVRSTSIVRIHEINPDEGCLVTIEGDDVPLHATLRGLAMANAVRRAEGEL